MYQYDRGTIQLRGMMKGICIVLLLLHFYYFCYGCFSAYKITFPIVDKIIGNFEKSGLFKHQYSTKIGALLFWLIGLLIGYNTGTAYQTSKWKTILFAVIGTACYFGSAIFINHEPYSNTQAEIYLAVSIAGFVMLSQVFNEIASFVTIRFADRIFNEENESFPQEERLLKNPHSVNLQARYRFRNRYRNSFINNVAVFRGTAVWGGAGSGKTRFVIRHYISQFLANQFTLFCFDFKFKDLSLIAYNNLLKHQEKFPIKPKFFVIDFDEIYNRCNPMDPASMHDLSDAAESSRTILLALNTEWIRQQGNFWVESAISFITANMWFLRKFEDGKYCTLPHLIELIQCDYAKLFSVLRSVPELETLISPFVSAFLNDTMDTLESQAASARIALASLSSPNIYYVLTVSLFKPIVINCCNIFVSFLLKLIRF